jgi:hypothetical protein
MSTLRTKPNLCPYCGALLDAAGSFDEESTEVPGPGDASICIGCAGLLVFTEDMGVRKLLDDDFAKLPAEHRRDLISGQVAVQSFRMLFGEAAQKGGHA